MNRTSRRLKSIAAHIFLAVEDWLIPPVCSHCTEKRFATLPLCRTCLRSVRDARPEEDEAVPGIPWIRALFRLTPPLHGLIHGFKYRNERRHVRFLCGWFRWRKLWRGDLALTYDALVPVPLHPARRRERGYNQAEAIARELAHAGGIPVRPWLLRRERFTATQTRLGGRGRETNLEGAFRAAAGSAGARLLLVDDVCTTGSTLSHCRDALLQAGAARVDALVLARVEKDAPAPLPDFETAAAFFA